MPRYLLFVLLAFSGHAQAAPQQGNLFIRNVDVVSPDRPDVQYDVDVLIEGGRIVAIGPNLEHDATIKLLEGDGFYLTPGLIDSHVHLYHATGLKPQYTENYHALYRSYMDQAPRSYLYFGYTTLIELNADFEAVEDFKKHPLRPRLFHCGQGLVLPDGFMALEYEEGGITRAFPNFLYDHHRGGEFPDGFDKKDHTPKAVVGKIADQGGVCVKMYYEEAQWWPGGAPEFALPTPEIVNDVVDAARGLGLPVILHATTVGGHEFGLEAKVDILAHGPWEWPDVGYDHMEPPTVIDDVVTQIAASETAIQPTLRTLRNTVSMFDPASLDHPALPHVLPAAYMKYLQTEAPVQRDRFLSVFGSSFKKLMAVGADEELELDEMRRVQLAFNERYEQMIGAMQAKGARLLFGTDTAVGGFGWGNPPGLNGLWEMQGWQRAGVPLRAIFEAATIGNAEAFGLDDELGTVSVGKRADLLLMRGNPLEALSAYNSIATAIVDGQPIVRESLSAQKTE